MSTKLLVALRAKYSSAMFRPPMTAIEPSAMKSLLCIRWLSRLNSPSDAAYRLATLWRAQQNGLKRRTSTLVKAASPRNIGSPPTVFRSSTSNRTRTPRNAASRRLRMNSRPLRSFWIR